MSVSGVGGSNSWFPSIASLNRSRTDGTAAKATSPASALGQAIGTTGFAPSGVQTVTAASGAQMNGQDANSFSQSMGTLSQALQDGDLSGAQDAFAKIAAQLKSAGVHGHHHHHHAANANASPANGTDASGDTKDPFAVAFGALGQALQSGDLSGAQDALTRLDGLLQGANRKLTSPPPIVDGYSNPSGGAVDLTA